jgi:hypothetical protein
MVSPTARGIVAASPIQTSRTVQRGTQSGRGTNPKAKTAIFGIAMPSSSTGHAAAAPTRAESMVFSAGSVWPNSATTAQPKIAELMRPRDRLMSANRAWITAIELTSQQDRCRRESVNARLNPA